MRNQEGKEVFYMKETPDDKQADVPGRYIDLHTHSTYSDGTNTPAEIVRHAKETGLSAISLTDHDTISGLEEARMQAAVLGIRFVDGVEINSRCHMDNKEINIHVLGYSFVPNALSDYMETLKALRTEHNRAILRALGAVGIPIEYEELEARSPGSTITRLNIARLLVQKGYAENVNDALHRYLHKEGSAYVACQYPPFSTVARKIHDTGGVVSLAHPAEYELSDSETESLIRHLTGQGLDAVECIHPTQNTAYTQNLMRIASKYRLSLTGGSDFHESREDGAGLGTGGDEMRIPESFLAGLCVRRQMHL